MFNEDFSHTIPQRVIKLKGTELAHHHLTCSWENTLMVVIVVSHPQNMGNKTVLTVSALLSRMFEIALDALNLYAFL